jgi:FkbM family methyltransferase
LDPNSIRKHISFDLSSKEIEFNFKNSRLMVNIRDHIGYRTYITGEPFEMAVYHLTNKLKPSGRTIIIDIGANIGTASVPVCAENNFELIAIEPSKENSSLLLKNIFINGIRAKVYCSALIDKVNENYIKLFINKGNTGANSLSSSWNPSVNLDDNKLVEFVPCKTFDEIFLENNIDINKIIITKIDVEGLEEAVLNGSKKFLELNTAPILLEYRNDIMQRDLNSNLNNVCNLLIGLDYEIYSIDKNYLLDKFFPSNSYENIVAIKRNCNLKQYLK